MKDIIYKCKCCNYETDILFSFKRHQTSKRHKATKLWEESQMSRNSTDPSRKYKTSSRDANASTSDAFCTKPRSKEKENFIYTIGQNSIRKIDNFVKQGEGFKCKHCKKYIVHRNNISRHYDKCIVRKIREGDKKDTDDKLEKCKEKSCKDYKELEEKYLQFIKKVIDGTLNNTTINNIDNSKVTNKQVVNNNTINMYYIMSNYTKALDYDEIMKQPLTQDELNYINDKGIIEGCYKLIKDRCLSNISLDDRSFFCLDYSRNKFLLRKNNGWAIDIGGEEIFTGAYNKIKETLLDEENIDNYIEKMKQMIELGTKGKKIIINKIKQDSMIKNEAEIQDKLRN